MTSMILSLDLREISEFYHNSGLYQEYFENIDDNDSTNQITNDANQYIIHIPADKYWCIEREGQTYEEILQLIYVCDYWMMNALPFLVMKSYESLSFLDKQRLLQQLPPNYKEEGGYNQEKQACTGQEYLYETLHKLSCLLIVSPSDVNQNNICYEQQTFLKISACGYVDVLDYFVNQVKEELEKYLLASDEEGMTGIMLASQHNHLSIISYLDKQHLTTKVYYQQTNNQQLHALHISCQAHSHDILHYLLLHTEYYEIYEELQEESTNNYDILLQIIQENQISWLQTMISSYEKTIKHINNQSNNDIIKEERLENSHKAITERKEEKEFNPFLCLLQERLLTYDEDKIHNLLTILFQYNQITLFDCFCQYSMITRSQLLITNQNGENMFMLCCEYSLGLDMIKYIFDHQLILKSDLMLTDHQGNNIFILACWNGRLELIKYLIDNSWCSFPEITSVNEGLLNGFMVACSLEYLEIVIYLIENTICPFREIYSCDEDGNNVFMLACRYGYLSIVQYLLENKTIPFQNIQITNHEGYTALMLACKYGKLPILCYLMETNIFQQILTCEMIQELIVLVKESPQTKDMIVYLTNQKETYCKTNK